MPWYGAVLLIWRGWYEFPLQWSLSEGRTAQVKLHLSVQLASNLNWIQFQKGQQRPHNIPTFILLFFSSCCPWCLWNERILIASSNSSFIQRGNSRFSLLFPFFHGEFPMFLVFWDWVEKVHPRHNVDGTSLTTRGTTTVSSFYQRIHLEN